MLINEEVKRLSEILNTSIENNNFVIDEKILEISQMLDRAIVNQQKKLMSMN